MLSKTISILLVAFILMGCGGASKLLEDVTGGTDDTVLPGKRESVLTQGGTAGAAASDAQEPIVIPAAQMNASWSQPGGSATNALGNLAVGPNLQRSWAANAGEGSSTEGRIIASPIVAGGAVFVLDSEANVTAVSANGGGRLWRTSLAPEGKSGDAFGGGLAADGGRIYATSPYGEVLALDASSGAVVWRKKIGAPVRAAPTIADGSIYFTGSSNEVFALRTSDGSEVWKYQGTGGHASIVSSTSPAVSGGFVIMPTTSGEVMAFSANDGLEAWSDSLTSADPVSAAANIGSIAGRPVIDGGQVFAISNAGRMAAFSLSNGERQWSRDISGSQTPWSAGDYVFVISNGRTLMAVSKRTGGIRWSTELAGKTWAGPVLGGGRLIAVSAEGQLVTVSPETGQILNTSDIGGAFYIPPVIANSTVYLLDDDATLIALR